MDAKLSYKSKEAREFVSSSWMGFFQESSFPVYGQ
jgi:hypothetical protein